MEVTNLKGSVKGCIWRTMLNISLGVTAKCFSSILHTLCLMFIPYTSQEKKVVPRNVLDTNTVHSSHKVHMCSNLNFQDELVPMNSSWDNETFAPLAISHHCIWLWLVASGKSRIRSNAKLSINTATQYNKSWSRNDIETLSASLTPFPLCVNSIHVVRVALLHHSRKI